MQCAFCDKLRERYRRFRQWQRTPTATEPLDDGEQHACLNCGESYDGRFCPRCGQSGKTRRLTMRGVMANALDVWGAGNRSMPRNIVHLLFRPGYMIADYLRGHRQPYFPPFKMLFIFTATLLIMVELVRWGVDYEEPRRPSVTEVINDSLTPENAIANDKKALHDFEVRKRVIVGSCAKVRDWLDDHRAISVILFQVLVAIAMWLFFRNSKRLPNLSISEQVFVQVFLSSQVMLVSAIYFVVSLLWEHGGVDDLPQVLTMVLYLTDYKQLFGFSWWGTIWRSVLAMLLLYAVIFLVILILGILFYRFLVV